MNSNLLMMKAILADKAILTDIKPELSETFHLLFDARDELVQSEVPMPAKIRALKNLSSLAVGFACDGADQKLVRDAERIVIGCVNRMVNAGLIEDEDDRDCFEARLRERVFLTLARRGSEADAVTRLNDMREEAQAAIKRLANKTAGREALPAATTESVI